jgi:hypothetical protein
MQLGPVYAELPNVPVPEVTAFADASERFIAGLSQIAHNINTTTPVARQVFAGAIDYRA